MAGPACSGMRAIAGVWSSSAPVSSDDCVGMLEAMSVSSVTIQQPEPGVVLGSSDYRLVPVSPLSSFLGPAAARQVFVADLRIDNHAELVNELGLPQTATDDEVLVHAWERWEYGVIDHLIGGFALACWDPARRTLFLARDHVGERPLYFTRSAGQGGRFAFASVSPGF